MCLRYSNERMRTLGNCHEGHLAKARATQDAALMLIRSSISILGLVCDRLLRLIDCCNQKDVNFSKEHVTILSKCSLTVKDH